jgi:pyridoxamine 5'-phosphate oxidase-like protein
MTTPSTELDTRFSDPGARPTSWQETLEAIKQAEIFWISTVRSDGRPHVTPLVAEPGRSVDRYRKQRRKAVSWPNLGTSSVPATSLRFAGYREERGVPVGREGLEPSTLGLRVPCSTS